MTTNTLPWIRYSDTVDRQISQHVTSAQIDAAARATWGTSATTRASGAPVVEESAQPRHSVSSANATRVVNGASEKQAKFIDSLLAEREHSYTEAQVAEAKADWRKTRTMIDTLLAASRRQSPARVEAPAPRPTARLDFAAIPDGNYALRQDGVVKFYRVSTTKTGFKKVQIRASDELYSTTTKAGIAILHRIVEAGLAESQMLFATELERCWMCGKSLTDETSRVRGTGPDCASK